MITMKMRYVSLILLSLAFGCSKDEDKPKGEYEHGAFIINEGGFGSSNGSVTFYNETTSEVKQTIIQTSSGFAGDVIQSLTFKDDKGYLVSNGDSKIEIVDANTFENLSTITNSDIVSPRYVEVIDDKAYVSVWGLYNSDFALVDSYVLVFDLKTNAVLKKIDTDEGTENLLYNGNYLFASNYNFGASTTLAVINPTDNSLVKQIELSAGPSGMVLDANGKLWIVCSGFDSGKLFRINPANLEIETSIEIPGSPGIDIASTGDKKNILYTVGKSVYKLPITGTTAQTLFEATDVNTFYSFNINPENDEIWIGDAMNYAAVGKAYLYNADGSLKTSFDAGINPTQFVFK
jgi:hypothetical protein